MVVIYLPAAQLAPKADRTFWLAVHWLMEQLG